MRHELHGIRTMFWKERRGSAETGSSRWAGAAVSAFIGIVVGYAFPGVVGFWAASGIVAFVGMQVLPSGADAFAGERERRTLEVLLTTPLSESAVLLGKVLAMVTASWTSAMGFLLSAVVGATVRAGELPTSLPEILGAGAVAFPVHTLLAFVGASISLRSASVRQALRRAAGLMFLLGVGPMTVVFGLTVLLPTETLRVVYGRLQVLATLGSGGWLLIVVTTLLVSNGVAVRLALKGFRRSRVLLV